MSKIIIVMKNKFHIIIFLALALVSCEKVPQDNNSPQNNPEKDMEITITMGNVSFPMVLVEHGTFVKGERDNESINTPIILTKDYYIGKYEVTQDVWKHVMGDTNPSTFKGDQYPVHGVSWDDCQLFIEKLNQITGKKFRLPTECEWEFAARGGNKHEPFDYSGSSDINEVAWYRDNSDNCVHPVGEKKPNVLGLYDMTGNVTEWTKDPYTTKTIFMGDTLVDPEPYENNPLGMLIKGGGFNYESGNCNVSVTMADYPYAHDIKKGLRLILYK
jgi:formylglycine-generating enzyme required for sulfatase activity